MVDKAAICADCRLAAELERDISLGAAGLIGAVTPLVARFGNLGAYTRFRDTKPAGWVWQRICAGEVAPIRQAIEAAGNETLQALALERPQRPQRSASTSVSTLTSLTLLVSVLASAEVIPQVPPALAEFEYRIHRELTGPRSGPLAVSIVSDFVDDVLRPDFQYRAMLGGTGALSSAKRCQYTVRAALRLVEHLQSSGLSIEATTTSDVLKWELTRPGLDRTLLPAFLAYLSEEYRRSHERLQGSYTAPRRVSVRPGLEITEAERQAALERCRHDHNIPLSLRCIAALTLTYGRPVTKLLDLYATALVETADGLTLLVRGYPLDLEPWLADIVKRQRSEVLADALVPAERAFLFPCSSSGATRPRHQAAVCKALAAHGLPGQPGRQAAKINIAQQGGVVALLASGESIRSALEFDIRVGRHHPSPMFAKRHADQPLPVWKDPKTRRRLVQVAREAGLSSGWKDDDVLAASSEAV